MWCIDATYVVYSDCKHHAGGLYTMGKCSSFTVLCKQKFNGKNSIEAEERDLDDFICVLMLRQFPLAQGYTAAETVITLQDNQSGNFLEQNGIMSFAKRTKHINII